VPAHALVPELVLAGPDDCERLLPEAADGEVEVWAGNDGFEAYGYTGGGYCWAHFPGTASFRFPADEGNVVALVEANVSPRSVEDMYLRAVLPLILQLRGHEVLHASAVSSANGLVVLCGSSGTGKSTTAHGLSRRGYPVWADDAVVLDIQGDDMRASQVPFRLRLHADAANFFRGDAEDRMTAAATLSRSPLLALVILDRQEGSVPPVRITRLEPTDAFVGLLPHAYYFGLSDPARKALMLDRYLRLASSVPTFEVRYRPGLGAIQAVLDEVEARILRGPS
jgi:hypothetical protein